MVRAKDELGTLVDQLGFLKARLADLERQEAVLKDKIASYGVQTAEGILFRLVISPSVKTTLDVDAVRKKLGDRWVENHCKHTPYTAFRVYSRTAKNIKD